MLTAYPSLVPVFSLEHLLCSAILGVISGMCSNACSCCRISGDLAQCIHSLNASKAAQVKSGDPAASIERTLDNQLNALNEVNRKCAAAEQRMEALGIRV